MVGHGGGAVSLYKAGCGVIVTEDADAVCAVGTAGKVAHEQRLPLNYGCREAPITVQSIVILLGRVLWIFETVDRHVIRADADEGAVMLDQVVRIASAESRPRRRAGRVDSFHDLDAIQAIDVS